MNVLNFKASPKLRDLRYTALLAGALVSTTASAEDAPSVVTSIKPIHSIASAIMEGVGEPHILIDGAASPHGFSLKPSQAFLLQGADAVFWVGPDLAPGLDKPIHSMASNAKVVELMKTSGIDHLDIREGVNFDAHDHDHGDEHNDHDGHGDHDEHDEHDEHDDHAKHEGHDKHEEHATQADHEEHDDHEKNGDHEDHGDEHAHEHGDHKDAHASDSHIWLNPENGIAIANKMAETLSEIDTEHADIYKANAKKFGERVKQVKSEISSKLRSASGKKFIVFHDAYHHFEHHFGIEASGAVTLSPEALPSADRISEVQSKIRDLNVTCVFQEPQFNAKMVSVVLEGSDARLGTLDPLGSSLQNGPDLYPQLLSDLAHSMKTCLSDAS